MLRLFLVMIYDGVILVGLLLIGAALASPFDSGNQRALQDPVFSLYLLAIWFAYLAACWRRSNMTLGMRAWGVRLDSAGGRPDWAQCLVRFGVSLVSAACAGIGFAWLLVDHRKRTWHDIASRTQLVRSS
ncbi:MAG: RDD family protein [Gammaproteobacteria bacterium]|nr:RDD family protein [Gammaproteobacteria bacterium]NNE06509.1 RDD family protein [Xanthomonadales bacterium]